MLQNAELAVIERAKVIDYLLCLEHPDGRSKAAFFLRFGFRLERWEVLADALRAVAVSNPIASSESTAHGMKHAVEGVIECPNGRTVCVRTIWEVAAAGSPPRLISAYPQPALEIRESIMNGIRRFGRVVLLTDVPAARLIDGKLNLVAGDIGVVVDILADGAAYNLEFFAVDGSTVAIAEVGASEVRAIGPQDVHHARRAA